MPETVNGLPTHVLLVHAVVVLLPLAAGLLVLAAALPKVQARLGLALPALALGTAVLTPITMAAGRNLRSALGGDSPLIARHAHLAGQLLPWAIAVLVMAVVVTARARTAAPAVRSARPERPAPRTPASSSSGAARPGVLVNVVVLGLSVVVAAGTVAQVARVGESGSRAVWEGVIP
jgi:hypothetical protein